jgi:hypothetical protein
MDADGVPGAKQIARHAQAHPAQSDKCDFHIRQHSDSEHRSQGFLAYANLLFF